MICFSILFSFVKNYSVNLNLFLKFVTQVKELLSESRSDFGNGTGIRWLGYSSDVWMS